MCWYNYSGDTDIASVDISVFKIVKLKDNGIIVPYYMENSGIIYGRKNGDEYEIEKDIFSDTPFMVYRMDACAFPFYECKSAFHSYSDCVDVQEGFPGHVRVWNRGTIDTYQLGGDGWKSVIMRCVIPGGTRYAVNHNGEYISDAIKIMSFEDVFHD